VSAEIRIAIASEADIVAARQQGRQLAATIGFANSDQTLVALAISEISRNIVTYATRGDVVCTSVDDGVHRGIVIVASDQGPGIPDIALAMRDGYSTGKSLGMGLPGAKRVMDEFEIVSTPGQGTTVTMKKWLRR